VGVGSAGAGLEKNCLSSSGERSCKIELSPGSFFGRGGGLNSPPKGVKTSFVGFNFFSQKSVQLFYDKISPKLTCPHLAMWLMTFEIMQR